MKTTVWMALATILLATGCQSTVNSDAAQQKRTPAEIAANAGTQSGNFEADAQQSEKLRAFNYAVPKNATATSTLRPEALVVGGVRFYSGGDVTIAANLRNKGGRTEICGAWAQSDGTTAHVRNRARIPQQVMGRASIQVGTKALARNLTFMGEVLKKDLDYGAPTSCILTQHAWRPDYASDKVKIRVPLQGYIN
ncbi:MAG: hypothetical protein AAFW87_04565 [Pseudomonadota bacterium]